MNAMASNENLNQGSARNDEAWSSGHQPQTYQPQTYQAQDGQAQDDQAQDDQAQDDQAQDDQAQDGQAQDGQAQGDQFGQLTLRQSLFAPYPTHQAALAQPTSSRHASTYQAPRTPIWASLQSRHQLSHHWGSPPAFVYQQRQQYQTANTQQSQFMLAQSFQAPQPAFQQHYQAGQVPLQAPQPTFQQHVQAGQVASPAMSSGSQATPARRPRAPSGRAGAAKPRNYTDEETAIVKQLMPNGTTAEAEKVAERLPDRTPQAIYSKYWRDQGNDPKAAEKRRRQQRGQ